MSKARLIASAVTLDLLAGDPPSLPHPVSAIAAAVRSGESIVRCVIADERAGGALLAVAIVGYAAVAGALLDRAPWPLRVGAAASTLAAGSLLDHVTAVCEALEGEDLPSARAAVARIVGRDTQMLDAPEIARAAIESLGESLCDGVVAPLCYLSCFGIAGGLAYKAINTLDSLIGHIEAPYTRFGSVAARLDDAANLLPARLTAIAVAAGAALAGADGARALRIALRDGRKHRSPNAGFGEAAMAGALGVRLGGRLTYEGIVHDAPLLGAELPAPRARDLRVALRVSFATACIAGVAAVALGATRR